MARPLRKYSMQSCDTFDGARHEGILRRRKSCLVKTVSFSETVSEQTLPAVPPPVRPRPTDEGDYVERSVNHEDGRQPRMRLRAPYFNSASDISRMNHETRQGARLTKPLSPEQERESEKKQAKYNKFGKVVLCVDDLPEDQDGDEFEYIGVYKCGNCTVGFAPVKKKKLMFVTLTERALNLHDSEKAYRCGKAAKRVIDLAIAFNAHGDHFDAKMKKCLCLMTPDETICMRPEGGIATIEGWRRALVKAIHEARRSKMDRIPRPEDIFDAVYDIIVCPNMKNEPKYQDSRKEHGFTNISNVIQELMGRRRLCLYPNTLAICGIYIEPTCYGLPAAGFPCFRASNMFILERSTIAFYGHCDNYFYIRIGKGSPYRGYEILFSVESAEVCKEISSRLNFLAERDIENRKVEMSRRPDQGPRVPTFNQPHQKFVKEEPGLKDALTEHFNSIHKKHSTQSERGAIMLAEHERKMSDAHPLSTKIVIKSLKESEEPVKPKVPPLKFNTNKPSGELLHKLQLEKERMERARKNTYDSNTNNPDGTLQEIKKDSYANIRSKTNPPELSLPSRIINSDDYTFMKPGEWMTGKVESTEDVMGSKDSCHSSVKNFPNTHIKGMPHLSCHMQDRSQSFGAKSPGPSNLPPTVNLPNSERKISAITQNQACKLEAPDNDPRKRAFSLGSRNFFNMIGLNDFRRLVSKRHRTSSPQHVSASGLSINSSNPSHSSGSLLNSAEHLEYGRTSSIGSGRNSPSKKSTGKDKKKSEDDLISIDFSNLGKKHSMSDARRYPFKAGSAGQAFTDLERERKEEEEKQRRDRERRAMTLKLNEEREAREASERKREKDRRHHEKKECKEKDKEFEKEKFRPKADSGIADCTPSSSFSSISNQRSGKNGDYVYADPEGLKFMAGIKKIKEEQDEQKPIAQTICSASSTSIVTVVAANDKNTILEADNNQKRNVQTVAKGMVAADLDEKTFLGADLNRKTSVSAVVCEDKEEGQTETESRPDSVDKCNINIPVVRKQSSSGSSLMSPFRRLKFLSFRK